MVSFNRGSWFAKATWLSFGNLNNGSNAGLFYVNGNNTLSNARWNYGSRLTGDVSTQNHVHPPSLSYMRGHAELL